MIRYVFLLCLYHGLLQSVHAQETSKQEINPEQLTDNHFAIPDGDNNYEDQYENLMQLMAHPLDLNHANETDLQSLSVLKDLQIKQFLQYRDSLGALLSVYELQAIPAFDQRTITQLLPLVSVKDPTLGINRSLLNRMITESNNYFILRYEHQLEAKAGYDVEDHFQRFRGTSNKLYARFRSFRAGDFSMGFTFEKDAGEEWRWKPSAKQYGFDYTSWHIQLQNKGRIKNLIMGDFQSQFGQGLIFGGLFGMGKGGETIFSTRKSNIGFLPYSSAYEAGSLRGVATTIELNKHIYLSGFYSSQHRDANTELNEKNVAVVSSFLTTGLHRNTNELSSRRNLRENSAGFVLQYKRNLFDAGIMLHSTAFNKSITLNETLYNQHTFEGKNNNLLGAYFNYTVHQAALFSEIARNTNGGGYGLVIGTLASLTKELDLSIVIRKYAADFTSFYSNALAENSTPRNETGIYWGWKYTFNRKINTSGYLDLFAFPWLRYRSYKPSYGNEWLLRITYQPTRKILCFAQIRTEQKERNISSVNNATTTYQLQPIRKTNYWLAASFDATPFLHIKTRAQYSHFSTTEISTTGLALVQDVQFRLRKFKLTTRYALFDTDDYDNRQYVYENDVWLAYSLPAYNGTGTRRYVQLEYKINKSITCWIRYAQFQYHKQETISSGLEEINGNTKSDIKCQVRIVF